MWDLIVSVPDHCLSFYFVKMLVQPIIFFAKQLYCLLLQTYMFMTSVIYYLMYIVQLSLYVDMFYNKSTLVWVMVLGTFQCRGVLLLLHVVWQGSAVLAAGAGWVGYLFCFSSIFHF